MRAPHRWVAALACVVAVGCASATTTVEDVAASAEEVAKSSETTEVSSASPFGVVTVSGTDLAPHPSDVALSTDASTDAAIGQPVPVVVGADFEGSEVRIGDANRATAVIFVAHWCPHCQKELPVVVSAYKSGKLSNEVELVVVSTAASPDRGNYPPQAWLAAEGWTGPTLVDDETSTAIAAYGGIAFPYMVFLDDNNTVVARSVGEVSEHELITLWDAVLAS